MSLFQEPCIEEKTAEQLMDAKVDKLQHLMFVPYETKINEAMDYLCISVIGLGVHQAALLNALEPDQTHRVAGLALLTSSFSRLCSTQILRFGASGYRPIRNSLHLSCIYKNLKGASLSFTSQTMTFKVFKSLMSSKNGAAQTVVSNEATVCPRLQRFHNHYSQNNTLDYRDCYEELSSIGRYKAYSIFSSDICSTPIHVANRFGFMIRPLRRSLTISLPCKYLGPMRSNRGILVMPSFSFINGYPCVQFKIERRLLPVQILYWRS